MKRDSLELQFETRFGMLSPGFNSPPTVFSQNFLQSLHLYDVDNSMLRLEAPSEGVLLDCCFQDDFVAFATSSDGLIRRSISSI
ncbi:hypothetical protein K1719_030367 [Acacia pycnantha]|nr:hypothetical protein K1719_030367 [Acacia pycnantha]